MALLKPKRTEKQAKFLKRFTRNQAMIEEFPEEEQRITMAQQQWETRMKANMTKGYEQIKCNFVSNTIREDTLEGRDCWVVNMVMITEGVHNGSRGAIYYPAGELEKFASAWNSKPIVVYHPEMGGQATTANSKAVYDRQKVGIVLNTQWDHPRLIAEAWIYKDAAARVDTRVVTAITNRAMMELSTGLCTDDVHEVGTWNGEGYEIKATNYRPDHLALLPDEIGACSMADGAGLVRNAQGDTWNELSFGEIERKIDSALRKEADLQSEDDVPWSNIGRIWDDFFIYTLRGEGEDDKLIKRTYTVSVDEETVILGDELLEVEEVTEFVPVTNTQKGKHMDRKKQVADLIANTKYEESATEFLMALDDASFEIVSNAATAVEVTGAADATHPEDTDTTDTVITDNKVADTPVAPTFDELLVNAKSDVRDMINGGIAIMKANKAKLVAGLVANKRCVFTAETLNTKTVEELEMLCKLGQTPSFEGQGDASDTTNAAGEEEAMGIHRE